MRPAPRRPGNSSTWSVMRAPAESTSQNTGSSWRSASSVSRTIFSTVRAPHEPALTVGSLAITHTGRPSTRPVPVTTPSAGRSSARLLASRPSSTNEPSSSSRAKRSRTNSLCWAASLSAPLARLPARARSVSRASSPVASEASVAGSTDSRSSFSPTGELVPPDGEDGDVVGHRLGGEVAGRLEQVLAQDVGRHVGVAAQCVGDALLPEHLLAVAGLRQPVGVQQEQVVGLERQLAAAELAVVLDHQQRARRPQRLH